jgi:hypothetical protein
MPATATCSAAVRARQRSDAATLVAASLAEPAAAAAASVAGPAAAFGGAIRCSDLFIFSRDV